MDDLEGGPPGTLSGLDGHAFQLDVLRHRAESAERRARTLLQLSNALVHLTSVSEMAAELARAIPDVIGCDAGAVLLAEDGVARVAAHHGFPRETEARLARLAIEEDRFASGRATGPMPGAGSGAEAGRPGHDLLADAVGASAAALAPLHLDGEAVGGLVACVLDRGRSDNGEQLLVSPGLADPGLVDPGLAERFGALVGQATLFLRGRRLLEQIRHQSRHDSLTGLPNRTQIMERAEQMLAQARCDQVLAAALFIDLDGFKEINDTLGHAAGDELLQQVSARLAGTIRANDTVGRLGSDEFVVLCDGLPPEPGAETVAARILQALEKPFHLSARAHPVHIGASIGIATGDYQSPDDLLGDADIALYNAKTSGKGCKRLFASDMKQRLLDRADLAERLADAVTGHKLFLEYQPIFDLRSKTTVGVEALLRWTDPTLGSVPPAKFVPVLEETGLIIEAGRQVLREACRQVAVWRSGGLDLHVAINASALQIERSSFVDDVADALRQSGLSASQLIIEITETALAQDASTEIHVLNQLKRLGAKIAIDDFGTGYSSLAYLSRFPVDCLKIDRSFIEAAAGSAEAVKVIRTVIELGRSLSLRTVAEGIEDRSQLLLLQREECGYGQGFLHARPLRPESVEAFLREERSTKSLASSVD